MKRQTLILSIVLELLCVSINAANVTQVGRYATVDNKPLAAQINPLLTVQQIHFPIAVKTVGQAVDYWVSYSGYHLADKSKLSKPLLDVLAQPLPQIDRNLGPLTVQEGLEVLVGKQVFKLVQDPLHRQVSFKMNRKYQALANKANKTSRRVA